jgi:uncharacterized protein YijF (DUF1287 family)
MHERRGAGNGKTWEWQAPPSEIVTTKLPQGSSPLLWREDVTRKDNVMRRLVPLFAVMIMVLLITLVLYDPKADRRNGIHNRGGALEYEKKRTGSLLREESRETEGLRQPGESRETTIKMIEIPRLEFNIDKDGDGINDLDDIIEGARKDMENKPRYKSVYYDGGYPPPNEGVCTDVIWRALMDAGYNLKDMLDKDIRENTSDYPRVNGAPDPNIDFRRVKNLVPFFKKSATSLTTEIIPGDAENLKEWQGGDIVVFDDPVEHIAIVSDKRRNDGVPLIIHNAGPYTLENDMILEWPSPITHHFRFPADS